MSQCLHHPSRRRMADGGSRATPFCNRRQPPDARWYPPLHSQSVPCNYATPLFPLAQREAGGSLLTTHHGASTDHHPRRRRGDSSLRTFLPAATSRLPVSFAPASTAGSKETEKNNGYRKYFYETGICSSSLVLGHSNLGATTARVQLTISLHQFPNLSQNTCIRRTVYGSSTCWASSSIPYKNSDRTAVARTEPTAARTTNRTMWGVVHERDR